MLIELPPGLGGSLVVMASGTTPLMTWTHSLGKNPTWKKKGQSIDSSPQKTLQHVILPQKFQVYSSVSHSNRVPCACAKQNASDKIITEHLYGIVSVGHNSAVLRIARIRRSTARREPRLARQICALKKNLHAQATTEFDKKRNTIHNNIHTRSFQGFNQSHQYVQLYLNLARVDSDNTDRRSKLTISFGPTETQ